VSIQGKLKTIMEFAEALRKHTQNCNGGFDFMKLASGQELASATAALMRHDVTFPPSVEAAVGVLKDIDTIIADGASTEAVTKWLRSAYDAQAVVVADEIVEALTASDEPEPECVGSSEAASIRQLQRSVEYLTANKNGTVA